MLWLAVILAPLFLQLALLYALSGIVNRIALARLGKTFYLLLMWPGVVVHELSHVVGCLVTGTRIREVHLFAPRDEGRGRMVLGFVTHDRASNAFATSVIGGAPFFGGAAALWGLTAFMMPAIGRASAFAPVVARAATASAVGETLVTAGRRYVEFVLAAGHGLDWRAWQTYLFLYLAFSVAAHVAPSRPDLKNAAAGAFAATVLLAVAAYAGKRWAPAFTAAALASFAKGVGAVTVLLGFGLAALFAAAAIFLALELLLASLAPRR
jgi:hypothetical protein